MTDDIDELREQTETGSRIEQNASNDTGGELQAAISAELDAIENGDDSPNLTVRDRNMAALLRALEARGELDDLGVAMDQALGHSPGDDYKKADIGRKALRLALRDVDEDLLTTLEDAVAAQIQV